MKILEWRMGMPPQETADLAYWERNMLALRYADGWYHDDIIERRLPNALRRPRYRGWRRVLTLDGGRITFHVPDTFDLGDLPQVERNWDGHTTFEKWQRIARLRGIKVESSNE